MNHTLETDDLRMVLQAGTQAQVRELVDRAGRRPLLREPAPLWLVEGEDAEGPPAQLEFYSATQARLLRTSRDHQTEVELQLALQGATLSLQLFAAGQPQTLGTRFPFLGALQTGDSGEKGNEYRMGEGAFHDGRGRPIFRRVDWPLPSVRVGADGRALTLIVDSRTLPARAEPARLWDEPGVSLELSPERRMVLQAELTWHAGGWGAAFELFRRRVRREFDLAQYARPDLEWSRDQLVQHFTFLYGQEILNLETGEFELERLLEEGEKSFGGYDGLLAWGGYPRLGVDERSQWDFYDDLPGGRAGLRTMARRARERGVRFFIPYLPWDRSAEGRAESQQADSEQLARLVAQVEADGVFLDTLSAVDGEMRAAIDAARPGVAFCSEGRPRGHALERITLSWDQTRMAEVSQGNWSAGEERMPSVDLGRFLFPEHRLFVAGRHAAGANRWRMIQRGFFNGMGWVVWQDIFGLAAPYTPAEAALLKKCRTILREHRQALESAQPTPLVRTAVPGVYANEFPAPTKRLWIFYNETARALDERVLRIEPRANFHLVDVWNDRAAQIDDQGYVRLLLAPGEVGALAELPRLLAVDREGGVQHAVAGAVLQLHPAGLARLVQDGELLDQIEIPAVKGDAERDD